MTTPESAYVARTLVILNPAAGQVPAERTRRLLGGAFAVRGAAFDLVETAGAGDAARLAREAVARGYRAVAAAGGDGTVAEVISGLAGSSTPLGIIPQGTANQLAFNLGVPSELERAVAVVVHGTPGAVDVGQLADGRYFALMAGAGWDAQVVSAATREQKDRWGFGATRGCAARWRCPRRASASRPTGRASRCTRRRCSSPTSAACSPA